MTDAFLAELRASAPPAPERLRERVEAIAAHEPRARASWREWLQPRRAVLVIAPAALAAMLAVAVAHGVFETPGQHEAAPSPPSAERAKSRPARVPAPTNPHRSGAFDRAGGGGASAQALKGIAGTPQAARGRKQDYRATLTVRVANVGRMSDAMKAAINATRRWGGYVVSARYDVPGRNGDAELVVRIPVQHVQAAIQRFSNLGTLAAQDVSIRDVQGRLDDYTRQLASVAKLIAKTRAELLDPNLTRAERATLEARLARAQARGGYLRGERAKLARTASFATVTLNLTTRAAAAAAPRKQGDVERTLRDAASILALELAYGLYALIVAAPFALVALLIWLGARVARRRADDRLLGST
ncbi:MAG TPA: DUF4349 domain-containing protein [Gaiellaceae bacterium]|nr:DUF4349 domain-containing protein [Gaiellaceae bacterium]